MLTREEFLALLARLRGEGDALTVEDLAAMAAYVSAPTADRDAVADAELAEVAGACRAMADDDEMSTAGLLAAVEVIEAIGTVEDARAEQDATEQAEREAARALLRGDPAPAADADATPPADAPAADADADATPPAADATPPDATPPADAPPADADATPPLPVAAAAAGGRNVPTLLRRRTAARAPEAPAQRTHNRIVRDGGGEYADFAELGQAMFDRRLSMLSAHAAVEEKLTIGSIMADYPVERQLDPNEVHTTLARQEAVIAALHNQGPEQYDAAVASGGLCAPGEPYYGYQQLATAERPMAASFQRFANTRGHVIWRNPPDFPDFASAVEIWTEANDSVPGSDGPATKPCLTVPCPGTEEAMIYAVTECLKFGNFMARTDPETIANAVANTAAAFARKAEVKLIDLTKAASTAVTAGNALGAMRDMLYSIGVAATGFRSRHRMRRDAVLEIRLPAWTYDAMRLDIMRQMPGDGTMTGAQAIIDRFLAENNVRVAGLYIDSPTGANRQVFGPQNATGLVDFPGFVQWNLTVPGSFLMMDNGRLDLGVIRDSTLVGTNDYKTFMETFEGLAFVGIESLWVTSEICPNGSSSGTVDPAAFCSGDYVPA